MVKRIKLTQTNDYDELKNLFIENEIWSEGEETVPTELVKCWKLTDEEDESSKPVGGLALAKREGEFIIDGIAINKEFRMRKLGRIILEKAIGEVRKMAGERLYLVARAPGFFRAMGFESVPKESAPTFFECLTCAQYEVSCYPEIMKYSIRANEN